ncbi:adhesin [Spiroplasma endosymbiont of Poecilobothrus nobilitatus]|uniref:adhesin n=1 Tax=Spiroplasma endosymbiont of Poecilobothrus nobilitatus TaxID=1209220 RepID=UPI00313B5C2A
MKKLLSLLTISTLTANVPAPLLANKVQERAKSDVGATAKDVTTGFNIKIKETLNNWKKVSANDNLFKNIDNKYYFVVWHGDQNNAWNINKFYNSSWGNYYAVDEKSQIQLLFKNNKYFFGIKEFYNDKSKNKITISKNEVLNVIKEFDIYDIDNNFNYIKSVYRWDETNQPPTPKIDSKGNITDWNIDKTKFQQGISFALVDGLKTSTWSNNGMRLTVDGETNININNPNVTEIYWDGVKQNMLEHKVNINVKPETSEKTHKLVIKYDINGTKYTSEDIDVVMAAKIEPIQTPAQQNLSDLVKMIDLGKIENNNDDTIKTKIIEKNSLAIDFSQIKITDKTDTQATLSAIEGIKSYQGSVVVKYNISSATTVDLKIDLTSSSSGVQIDKNYLAQLDKSKMTNKVNTFYYANGKSVIKIKQPPTGNVITGVVYGCDEQWNKTSHSNPIDPVSGLEIDKGQYGSVDGRYLIEFQHKDLSTHTKNIYLQISEKQKVSHYWDTDNGKHFEQWAEDNDKNNIRGYSANQLNNLFELSQTWKQSLTHLDLKLDNIVVDNIQNVTQDEIDNYKTKMLASVKAQVEKYVPDVVENTDYKILVDNLVSGDWTTSKDVKVQAVDGSTKLLSFTAKTIPAQSKEQPISPTPNPEPTSDNEKVKSFWKIVGIVAGAMVGFGTVAMLLWRYLLRPWKMKVQNERSDKKVAERRAQWAKEESEAKVKAEQESEEKNNGGDNS